MMKNCFIVMLPDHVHCRNRLPRICIW